MLRAFSTSYLAGEPAAHAFFAPVFRDQARRIERARHAARRAVAPALLRVLREQQFRWGCGAAHQSNLDALVLGNTAVVVTGQQVGVFLGPLYAFYKAASAIAVARAIEQESGVRCVPLFWLQSEDHDFEEIRSCNVADTDGQPRMLALPDACDGRGRSSVAYRLLPDEVTSLLDELGRVLPAGPQVEETLAFLREHYQPGRSVVAAFARAMSLLFADDGLLFLDPRDPKIAELASPVYRRCLDDCAAIEQTLRQRGQALAAAGFAEQVAVRDRGALLFFHEDDERGPRVRLLRSSTETTWRLAGTSEAVSCGEIASLFAQQPLRFSSSALLRPIVQDALLPTVAYVGGPGEINYFAQVQPLYRHFDLEPPLLVPRARFRVLDSRSRRWLGQLDLVADDACAPTQDLLRRLAPSSGEASMQRTVAETILPAVESVVTTAEGTRDASLSRLAKRTRERIAYRLERLLDGYARVAAERDTVVTRRLQRLQWALCPDGIPQERFYAWPWLASQLGVAGARRAVLDRLAERGPFVTELQELEL